VTLMFDILTMKSYHELRILYYAQPVYRIPAVYFMPFTMAHTNGQQ